MELRRTPRAPIDLLVEFAPKSETTDRRGGRAKDISIGGMFVETPDPPGFGAEVLIELTLPGERSAFVLPGVVRWTDRDGMGVQFRTLSARETFAITEIVRIGERRR
ncbi:PilZ domain-containing protein [Pendulispora albinea]|uniref:PilZ domain-containing protein n=1 Tax=Pendulispora albinea TaxID=2741071 RepID=A0ABZ2LZQ6_9BACT